MDSELKFLCEESHESYSGADSTYECIFIEKKKNSQFNIKTKTTCMKHDFIITAFIHN